MVGTYAMTSNGGVISLSLLDRIGLTAAVTVAPPPVVPGVTTVHTGEFWAGTLPIVLSAGMALSGLALIGRRRIVSTVPAALHHSRRLRR
jgi:hypothetical protein